MDLTAWLLQRISVRPLLVSTVGGTAARLAAEQRLRRQGWRPAPNPAEANLLIVAGPRDPAMEPFLEAVWRVVPGPRSRADIADPAEADAKLTEAEQQLRSGVLPPDADLDRHEAARSQHPPADNHGMHGHEMHHGDDAEPGMGHGGHHEHAMDHSGHAMDEAHDTGDAAHGGHDMSQHGHQAHDSDDGGHQGHDMGHSEHQSHDMGHGGHHGHDMGGMSMPGGIPMADRADDRDGLKLDRLTVPLGPVLPAWPAGLLVRTTLQGDVIQEAEVEAVRGHPHGMEPFWDTLPLESTRIAARRLDSCARLLSVAGWEDAAVAACRLRDDLLAGRDVGGQLARWARRVRRSRTLRWSLSGLGRLDRGALAGDTADRLYRWLDEATGAAPATVEDPDEILALLPDLLAGAELAAARLIVAGLDPDLERTRVTHG